jgi:hypothetical protein
LYFEDFTFLFEGKSVGIWNEKRKTLVLVPCVVFSSLIKATNNEKREIEKCVWKCGKSRPLYGKATIVIVSVLLLSHMLLDYTLYSVLKNYLVLSVHSFMVIKSF